MPADAPLERTLERYLRLLLVENEHLNLTSIRDFDTARILHVQDSLAIRDLHLYPSPRRCLDLGSGNGFPGVALALLYPDADVVLLDRTAKKLAAIERVLAAVPITGITTVHADATHAPHTHPAFASAFDLIIARALGSPELVARLAAPLCARGGRLVLWLDAERRAPTTLGRFRRARVHAYELPAPAPRHRRLALYEM